MDEAKRKEAATLYNAAWEAFEAHDLGLALSEAEKSLAIWQEIGGPKQWAIGNWMVGRIKAYAGDFVGARHSHKIVTEETAKIEDAPDWLLASNAELGARCFSNEPGSEIYLERYLLAEELIALISEHEEQVLIAGQFADLPRPE